MKRKFGPLHSLFIAMSVVAVTVASAGCCALAVCDCDTPLVYFTLSPGGDFCAGSPSGKTHVRSYDIFWKQVSDVTLDGTCGVEVGWIGTPAYYLFISDSTGAVDTLKLTSVSQTEIKGKRCCSCDGPVNGVSYSVNGVGQTSSSDHINLPF